MTWVDTNSDGYVAELIGILLSCYIIVNVTGWNTGNFNKCPSIKVS